MEHVAGRYTGEKLMKTFVSKSFREIGGRLEQRLNDLLWPYQKSHPSTQNPSFSARVSPAKRARCSESTEDSDHKRIDEDGVQAYDSWVETALDLNFTHNLVSAADTLDTADAYYDVSIVSGHAEQSLIRHSWHWTRSSITPLSWASKQFFLMVSRAYSPTTMLPNWKVTVWLTLPLSLHMLSKSARCWSIKSKCSTKSS
jgi:hypothetical protein